MSYEQYLFYTAQLSQMFGISSLPPLQLLVLGSSRTSDNLDKFASNDSLSCSVVQDLEAGDHVAGVLGGVVHGVTAGRLFTRVTLSERPVKGVGQGVLAQVGKDGIVDFVGREVGYAFALVVVSGSVERARTSVTTAFGIDLPDSRMASSEKASMTVAS